MDDKGQRTREEILRKFAESKRRKRECLAQMEKDLRQDFKQMTGQEAIILDVW